MKSITAITSQSKGDRLNVFLDGEFAFGVEYATAHKFGLKVGVELSDETIDAIQSEEGNSAAFNKGLKYAVKKVVSRKQIKNYLIGKGFSTAAVDEAIDKLMRYGYVDDLAYAKAYVSTYSAERGPKRLTVELKEAGIDDEIIADALEMCDEESSCDRCVDKYLRTHERPDKQKLINYLIYRGFEWDTINDAISRRELWK